ncbi:MAG: immunity 49 family protein [Leptospirales bacterium]|nr:immunity 49 family protein [Leptospirales bacterium]
MKRTQIEKLKRWNTENQNGESIRIAQLKSGVVKPHGSGLGAFNCDFAIAAIFLDNDPIAARKFFFRGAEADFFLTIRKNNFKVIAPAVYRWSISYAIASDSEAVMNLYGSLPTRGAAFEIAESHVFRGYQAAIVGDAKKLKKATKDLKDSMSHKYRHSQGIVYAFEALLQKDPEALKDVVPELLRTNKWRNLHNCPNSQMLSLDTLALIKLANRAGMKINIEHALLGPTDLQEYKPLKKYSGYPFLKEIGL